MWRCGAAGGKRDARRGGQRAPCGGMAKENAPAGQPSDRGACKHTANATRARSEGSGEFVVDVVRDPDISIHAPREGSDAAGGQFCGHVHISTLAPREGSDRNQAKC